jgi:hypothetical protein
MDATDATTRVSVKVTTMTHVTLPATWLSPLPLCCSLPQTSRDPDSDQRMEDSSPSQNFSPHPMDFSLAPALPQASSRYPQQNAGYHRPNAFASSSNTLWMDSDSSDHSRSMSSSSSVSSFFPSRHISMLTILQYHTSPSLALATADHLFEAGNRAYISAFQQSQVLGAQLKESRSVAGTLSLSAADPV